MRLTLLIGVLLAVERSMAEQDGPDSEATDLDGSVQRLIADLKKYGDKIPVATLVKLNDAFDELVHGLKGTTKDPSKTEFGAPVVEQVSVGKLCEKMKMDAHLIPPVKLFVFLKNTLEIIEEAAYQKSLDKKA